MATMKPIVPRPRYLVLGNRITKLWPDDENYDIAHRAFTAAKMDLDEKLSKQIAELRDLKRELKTLKVGDI